jgi:hypothetical protein
MYPFFGCRRQLNQAYKFFLYKNFIFFYAKMLLIIYCILTSESIIMIFKCCKQLNLWFLIYGKIMRFGNFDYFFMKTLYHPEICFSWHKLSSSHTLKKKYQKYAMTAVLWIITLKTYTKKHLWALMHAASWEQFL